MDKPRQKFQTTSSVYIDCTISKPNSAAVISSVATILHSQMMEDMADERVISEDSELFFFSEEKYI